MPGYGNFKNLKNEDRERDSYMSNQKKCIDKKNMYFFTVALLLVLQIIANVYFGFQKQGFHEDEYYTYFSSNRSLGLYKPDREWQSSETIANEFMVVPGEGFNYSLVSLVQSWDVHPPLYYFIFHTLCSITAGILTKWTGIVTNLIAFAIAYLILWRIMVRLKVSEPLQLVILAFWGFNPMTISFNMFIRMYMWLTGFVFACTYLHIRFVIDTMDGDKAMLPLWKLWITYLLPIMVVSYLGFLTQYFYMIFFFFMGVGTAMYMLVSKRRFVYAAEKPKDKRKDKPDARKVLIMEPLSSRIKLIILYVISCAVALGLAVLSYPASASHIFSGYRGTGAIESFTDASNFTDRLTFFIGLLNNDVFGGLLIVLLLFMVIAMIYFRCTKDSKLLYASKMSGPVAITAFAAVMYFLVVSKTGLLLGRTSNRYEMPIYGLVIMLVMMDAKFSFDRINKSWIKVVKLLALIILFIPLVYNLTLGKKVLFLYPEDAERIAYAADNSDIPVIIYFNEASSEKIWWMTNELLEYPQMYFMSESDTSVITDETICVADELLVYIADNDNTDECIQCIFDSNDKLSTVDVVSVKDVWTLYRFE